MIDILVDLNSSGGIDSAIKDLKDYRTKMESKLRDLLNRLGQIGVSVINAKLTGAAYAGAKGSIDVHTEFEQNSCVIVISGEKVAFIEFGAGINFPEGDYAGQAGASPHGTYGRGQGSNPKGWIYRGEQGDPSLSFTVFTTDENGSQRLRPGVWRTFGNPPANSVTAGIDEIKKNVTQIVSEVFGS